LTFKIPTIYTSFHPNNTDRSNEYKRIDNEFEIADKAGYDYMSFFGVGNHGGGPTIEVINFIHDLQGKFGNEALFISSPDRYFNDIKETSDNIKVYSSDLQNSASLCYSAHSGIKKSNRKAENRLISAEKFAALAHKIMDLKYKGKTIQKAWKKVLFNQFHDILCGCSIKEAYDDAEESYGAALDSSAVVLNSAMQKISWAIDTTGLKEPVRSKESDWFLWEHENNGAPLIVFNPLSWEAEIPVRINKEVKSITDEKGEPILIQHVRSSQTMQNDNNLNCLIAVKIPAMGYRSYRVYLSKQIENNFTDRLNVNDLFLENDHIRLDVELHTGYLKRIFDKKNNINVLSGAGAVPVVVDIRHCDTWGHQYFRFRDDMAKFADAKTELIETGPVRARIRSTSLYNDSTIIQDYILYNDRSDIEVHVKLDWREKRKLLKLSFPVDISETKAVYEIPYGFIEREADGNENPGLNWVCLIGNNNNEKYGLAILNDCKYSFDAEKNDLRMTVANSSVYADHRVKDAGKADDDLCEYLDQGIQEFKYVLKPFTGEWQDAGIVKRACELNTEPIYVMETYHKGILPQTLSGIEIGDDNIIASVFKRAEDGNGYIVRCYETAGRVTDTTVSLPILDKSWSAKFNKCEIKTFFIPDDKKAEVTETNLLELV